MNSVKDVPLETVVQLYCTAISILEITGIGACIYQFSQDHDMSTTFFVLTIISLILDLIKFLFALTVEVILLFNIQLSKKAISVFEYINLGFVIGMSVPAVVMPTLFIIFFEDSEFALYPQYFVIYVVAIILYSLLKENIIVFFYLYFKEYLASKIQKDKKKYKELKQINEEKEVHSIQIDPELKDVPIYLWDYVKMVKNKEIKKN